MTATRRFRPVTFGLVLAALTWRVRWFEGFGEMGFAWIVKWVFSAAVWRRPMKDLRAMEAIFSVGAAEAEEKKEEEEEEEEESVRVARV
ncbi:hypothetical protein TB2_039082 [Malus domestica]